MSSSTSTFADAMSQTFLACYAQQNDLQKRLDCYDQAVKQYFAHDFSGIGAFRSEVFARTRPFKIKYENNDVIFVIYVYRENSELVTSYGTGPGVGELAISSVGRFFIEIKATGAWKLWLEEEKANETKLPFTALKDYQLRRLVQRMSQCQLKQITQINAIDVPIEMRDKLQEANIVFSISCYNQTFYPAGLYIACSTPDIEDSCKALNTEIQFEHLNKLQ